jgi:two-component system invasion response regulator UvrY
MDVLVVDDQSTFRAVARTLIRFTAGLRTLRPPVVLMDINLPGISGIEATRRLRASDPSIKVILMSTYAAADLPADAMESGAVGYVRKEDLTPAALAALLDR